MRPEPLHAIKNAGLFAFLQMHAEAVGKMLRMVLPGEAYNLECLPHGMALT